jgi:parallel beta-helix repeat protein
LVPSSPTIDHCRIANSVAESGGAILCMDDSEAVITNNTIVDNSAEYDGGGIYIYAAYGTIANNVIAHNSGGIIAGGVINSMGSASMTNNTIVHNRPSGLHLEMAMWSWDAGPPAVLNNIIWQNEMYMSEDVWSDEYDIRFNDIQGGWEGDGNINVDPCFADAQSRDYHLKSEAGRWDPQTESWVTDDVTSACIDAGDPDSDWIAEFWPRGEHINMGAFGGTSQASLSLSTVGPGGDLNNDEVVDAKDLIMLMDTWLRVDALLVEDVTRDGVVNFCDFAVLAADWIEEQ